MAVRDQYGRDVTAVANAQSNGKGAGTYTVLDQHMRKYKETTEDPYTRMTGVPPNLGRFVLPHVMTFQGLFGSYSRAYRPNDEALKHSKQNARFMRNDCGVMECVESRQRSTALLDWQLIPEDEKSADQQELCGKIEKILRRIRRFTEYRYNLLHATWFGRYGIQHRWGWQTISGRQYIMPVAKRDNPGWIPIHGDKLVFRYDDGTIYSPAHGNIAFADQVGILVGARGQVKERIGNRWTVEPTGRGLAYFLTDWERDMIAIHKHMIEDGPWEDGLDAGTVHGVGIRSRIYWDWFQKQEMLAFLISYLERSAGGIEIWSYPAGDAKALAQAKKSAEERLADGRNIVFFPRPMGPDGALYDVQIVEPGLAGIEVLQHLMDKYFGHRIKRYILGQTLTSEADATGLGSGLAELHLDTLLQIIKYDATNLEETITHELIDRIKNWNFPAAASIEVRFQINTESPDVEKKLEGFLRAFEMGARIKERDVMEMIGAAIPTEDDRVLEKAQESGGMMGGMGAESAGQTQQQRFNFDPKEINDTVLREIFGEPGDLDGRTVSYVAEGGKWVEREVPSAEFDTGNRKRAEGEPVARHANQ